MSTQVNTSRRLSWGDRMDFPELEFIDDYSAPLNFKKLEKDAKEEELMPEVEALSLNILLGFVEKKPEHNPDLKKSARRRLYLRKEAEFYAANPNPTKEDHIAFHRQRAINELYRKTERALKVGSEE